MAAGDNMKGYTRPHCVSASVLRHRAPRQSSWKELDMAFLKGLDDLQRTLSEAQKALEAVNGELGTLSFNPEDPGSVEAAIAESERLVDERLGKYANNPIVGPLMVQMKQSFRTAVIEKAAEARLKGEASDGE